MEQECQQCIRGVYGVMGPMVVVLGWDFGSQYPGDGCDRSAGL